MDHHKKRIGHISGITVALFIAPLIVFAVVYNSSERKNSFAPGSVDIKVNEGNGNSNEGEVLTKDYFWQQSDDNYIADKNVKIKDNRKYPGEMLRVMFVPMWYDKDPQSGDATDVCSGVFNFGTVTQSGNTLTYCDHNSEDGDDHSKDKIITLNMNSDWEQRGWSYSDPNVDPPGDGCFYYSGTLDSSKLTAQLLDSVELNANAYALTENYVFRLDVLADAIQVSGNAAETREWDPPRS